MPSLPRLRALTQDGLASQTRLALERKKRKEVSCTSKSNAWIEPPTTINIPYRRLEEIDFTSSEKKMAAFQDASPSTPEQAGTSSSSLQLQPTKDELTELYRKCSGSTVVPILFSIEEAPYNETFTQSLDHLPLPLQSFYNPEYLKCNYTELLEIGEGMKASWRYAQHNSVIWKSSLVHRLIQSFGQSSGVGE